MAGDNRLITENFLRLNFTPKSGITPGTNDLLIMDCTQILARYQVAISGSTTGSTRCPSQNELVSNALAVGSSYQGGIIAYIFVSGDSGYVAGQTHGLIVASSDQGSANWQNIPTTQNLGTSSVLGAGSSNTSIITTKYGAGTYAAKLCSSYSSGGYSGWYLPSKDELNKLYLNRVAINAGFGSTIAYWSSTEYSASEAWTQNLSTGVQTGANESRYTFNRNVRAIRSF